MIIIEKLVCTRVGSSSSQLYQDFFNISCFFAFSAITRRWGERFLISSHGISSRLILIIR